MFLEISQNSQENACVEVSFMPATLLQRDPTHAFYCEYSEIFKKTVFYKTPSVAAFENKLMVLVISPNHPQISRKSPFILERNASSALTKSIPANCKINVHTW